MTFLPPRPIRADDDASRFDCGNQDLNRWLVHTAWRAEVARTARTYVCLDESGSVVGYYCLSSMHVDREDVGGGRLARNAPVRIPVVLLGRLAVDARCQGRQLGTSLLQDAVLNAAKSSVVVGSRALVVEAVDEAAAGFYRHHGFRPFPGDALKLYESL
ncbi:MAG: GNAT family N-acetyltransferase [Propionibacteriaceae bacterium]|jgi:GNAT superfamily N-acetyltransferase|nr:GNAT family N-acetyltransferase [Propionibacteriaceae bacterium]